jgi:monoterpene epsilon-lactone hydrolase
MTVMTASGHTEDVDEERGRVLAFPQAPEAIEMRHLRSFVAVAEDLNFGRAAQRLYLSQPALSRQISTLEKLVGCELFRRSTHRVELTLAGEALLDRARRLLEDLDEAVSITQSVGDELATRLARLWKPMIDAAGEENLEEMRAAYEALHAQFAVPEGVTVRPVNAGGVPSLVVGEQPPRILFLHGGGHMLGSAFGYRPLVAALALEADAGALVPDFRLAPEHPFPAGLEDAQRAYGWMLEQGLEPAELAVAGDSAGGALAISLLVSLRDQGVPLPGSVVLLCPGVDLTGGTLDFGQLDDALAEAIRRQMQDAVDAYLQGHPMDDPLVSPLNADLSGLPPMLVQAATGDMIRPDAQALADRARAHGVDVRLELYPVSTHVFQIFWSFLPEASDALHQAGLFVREVSPRRSATKAKRSPR